MVFRQSKSDRPSSAVSADEQKTASIARSTPLYAVSRCLHRDSIGIGFGPFSFCLAFDTNSGQDGPLFLAVGRNLRELFALFVGEQGLDGRVALFDYRPEL